MASKPAAAMITMITTITTTVTALLRAPRFPPANLPRDMKSPEDFDLFILDAQALKIGVM